MVHHRRRSSTKTEALALRRRDTTNTRVIPDLYRRMLVIASVLFFLTAVFLAATRLFEWEEVENEYSYRHPFRMGRLPSKDDLPMSYGNYGRPKLDDVTLVASIPGKLIPTATNHRRFIMIGDIHGMLEEFEKLLEEVGYDKKTDHIIAAGDMVNKGPDTPGLVRRMMELEASAVRGNHEDKLLLAKTHADNRNGAMKVLGGPPLEEQTGVSEILAVARSLTEKQLQWLSKLPVILDIEPLSLYVVHAGLVPGLEIMKQDPWAVMNMRTISYPREHHGKNRNQNVINKKQAASGPVAGGEEEEEEEEKEEEENEAVAVSSTEGDISMSDDNNDDNDENKKGGKEEDYDSDSIFLHKSFELEHVVAVPLDDRRGVKWANEWDAYQRRLKPRHRKTVFYGHDAKEGYQVGDYTYGLDSGCVKGGNLTAIVLEADADGGYKTLKRHVPCRKFR